MRRSAITPQESQEAWQRFLVLREQRLHSLPLVAEDFEVAARFCLAQVLPPRFKWPTMSSRSRTDELKRRGIAAIEQAMQHCPVHL
ncbi:hypothetical protein SynWH8103_00473 [Synechococcus sp. WH 8103]|nr:hypothetical protein SynWH8103_00473 [Synechococcus sp. WH 8103]